MLNRGVVSIVMVTISVRLGITGVLYTELFLRHYSYALNHVSILLYKTQSILSSVVY